MDQKQFKQRIYITGIIIFIISLFFIFKLFNLHFSNKIVVDKKKTPDIIRGYIKDRRGEILALSVESSSLYANFEEIKNPEELAGILSSIINIPNDILYEKLSRKKRFIWLKRKLNNEEVMKIQKLGVKGLHFKKEYKRLYPNDNLASNIIGFADVDNKGLEGIEFKYDSILSGSDIGDNVPNLNEIKSGQGVILTIDRFVQYVAEKAIENSVRESRAKQGAALVMDVKTGKILAMAKYPNINPNYYYKFNDSHIRNFSVVDSFEPGSTFKIFSAAAMIENNPEILKKVFTCNGKIDLFDTTINCTDSHGRVDVAKSLRYSCNVGIIEAIKSVPKEKFYSSVKRFGFGEILNTRLAGESEGIFRDQAHWSGLSKFSISIGHEISVTSLQMAAAVSAVANRGIYTYPSIVEGIEDQNGNILKRFPPVVKGRVLSDRASEIVLEMMRDVVANGTGVRAFSRSYTSAGKTGTSRKFSKKAGEYSDKLISSFIGIAPYENPEICIYIVIDDPAEKEHGSRIAAPVFREIADRILPQMGIKKASGKKFTPLNLPSKTSVFDGKSMPDFTGLNVKETLGLLSEIKKRLGVEFIIAGTGRVYEQKPDHRTTLDKKQKITVFLKEGIDDK